MTKDNQQNSEFLIEHFFRNEYGKIVAVISKYVAIETAEDIVQETLLTAVEYWQHKGIPPNPNAWLYTTAKNKALNILRNHKYERGFQNQRQENNLDTIEFTDEEICDEQLRVMTECCHPSISEETQITLILKILCGFSIGEIASAFYTKNETINKRLVRGRDKLKKNGFNREKPIDINQNQEVLLKTIYLLFNEGYFPSRKNQVVRKDFCLEAIRLAEIIVSNKTIMNRENAHALLALMCLNCSRFEARTGKSDEIIEMELQDRTLWNQDLLNKGLYHLSEAQKNQFISKYLILAGISANHSISQTYELTNWQEILSLYDVLLKLENSAIVRLNRLVALSKVKGPRIAISELLKIKELSSNHLYYSTLAELYKDTKDYTQAINYYEKAISISTNPRDKQFLTKKLNTLVPISKSHV
jgi:RNA polymerase sigma factor (sigma-70 family)